MATPSRNISIKAITQNKDVAINSIAQSLCYDASCAADRCNALSALGTIKSYQAGDVVFWQGDPSKYYFLIVSGVMRGVRYLEDGRRQITRFIFPGDLVAHIGSSTYAYGGETITSVKVRAIPRAHLDKLVSQMPCLGDLITRSILEELRETQDQLLILGQLKATERVAHFLCDLKERLYTPPGKAIEIPMSRCDIADYLGLTIETVSRVISRLKMEGKITLLTSNKVTLTDPHKLDCHYKSFAA